MFVHIREPIICPKISGKGCQMKTRDRNAKFAEEQGLLAQSKLCSKKLRHPEEQATVHQREEPQMPKKVISPNY
jgi:hypothetical protein